MDFHQLISVIVDIEWKSLTFFPTSQNYHNLWIQLNQIQVYLIPTCDQHLVKCLQVKLLS